jgi:alkaline phosphatase D
MRERRGYHTVGRRDLLAFAASLGAGGGAALSGSCRCNRTGGTPETRWGVQSGDVGSSSGVVWSRADRGSRLVVEWDFDKSFANAKRREGPVVTAESDFAGKVLLDGLPNGTRIHYRARFENEGKVSDFITGSFTTVPTTPGTRVLIAWSGDTNGQGWGIDAKRGGMPAYTALREREPHLFIHCGDRIYADNPIEASIKLADGSSWENLVTPEKSHVAQTLADFRGAYAYGHLSAEVRAASAAIPLLHIWDDHEVHNNWFPGEVLADDRYKERRTSELMVHARRAMWEWSPTLRAPDAAMYTWMPWGPAVDVFLLDGRTARSPNEPTPPVGGLLGQQQADFLIDSLSRSRATWKIIACGQPIALVISEPGKDGKPAFDGWGNENGPPTSREVELARVLSTAKKRGVKNIVFVTADVHYAAAHRFDPARAQFKDFDPFWELVAGPMHASAFGAKPLDDTFGPELVWSNAKNEVGSPAEPRQSFGLLQIEADRTLTVTFVDGQGHDLHKLTLRPAS